MCCSHLTAAEALAETTERRAGAQSLGLLWWAAQLHPWQWELLLVHTLADLEHFLSMEQWSDIKHELEHLRVQMDINTLYAIPKKF